jgi:hypothetical protein
LPPLPPHSQAEQEFGLSGQSLGQEQESSVGLQIWSPQTAPQDPQSEAQEVQSSPGLQMPSPQL